MPSKAPPDATPFDPARHIMQIQGRDYLPAAWRIVWFRQEHPEWTVETRIIEHDPTNALALMEARVIDDDGRLRAVGHKMETAKDFRDYLEKAETGAVSRALTFLGYGTQYALELDTTGEDPTRTTQRPQERATATPGGVGAAGGGQAPQTGSTGSTQGSGQPAYVKRFWAQAREGGHSEESVKETMRALFPSATSTKDLSAEELDRLLTSLATQKELAAPMGSEEIRVVIAKLAELDLAMEDLLLYVTEFYGAKDLTVLQKTDLPDLLDWCDKTKAEREASDGAPA